MVAAFDSDDDDVTAHETAQPRAGGAAKASIMRPTARTQRTQRAGQALESTSTAGLTNISAPRGTGPGGFSSESEGTSEDSVDGLLSNFAKSPKQASSTFDPAYTVRRADARTRSDTTLFSSTRPNFAKVDLNAMPPRAGIKRARTTATGSALVKSSQIQRRPLAPSSRNRTFEMFFNDSSDSNLSADEGTDKGVHTTPDLVQTSAASTTQKRPRTGRLDPHEKERLAQAKKAEKAALKADKEKAKADKHAQAERDKAWQEVNKLRKSKAEAMAEVQIEMDCSLFTPGTGPLSSIEELLIRQIKDDGADVVVDPESEITRRRRPTIAMAIDEELQASFAALSTLRVVRKSRATLDSVRRTFVPLPPGEIRMEEEKSIFIVVPHLKFLEMVENKTLLRTMRSFRECMGYESHQLIILTYGINSFFRARSQANNRQYTERIRQQAAGVAAPTTAHRRNNNAAHRIDVSQEQFDMEMVRLRIAERCYVNSFEKVHDLLPWIMSMIRDVAIRPYKLLTRSHLPIPVMGGKFPSGNDSRETFELMLEQIPRVTKQHASAIASHFGSLRNLLDRCAQTLADSTGRLNADGLPVAAGLLTDEISGIRVERTQNGRLANCRSNHSLARRIVFVLLSLDALALVST